MSSREHHLKTWPRYFSEVRRGVKSLEIRHDDRGYQVGDVLVLQEFKPHGYRSAGGDFTGEEHRVLVTHMMRGGDPFIEGLPSTTVIMSIRPLPATPANIQWPGPDYPHCQAGSDGECFWPHCPQIRDGEPEKTGRHCPIDNLRDED